MKRRVQYPQRRETEEQAEKRVAKLIRKGMDGKFWPAFMRHPIPFQDRSMQNLEPVRRITKTSRPKFTPESLKEHRARQKHRKRMRQLTRNRHKHGRAVGR